MEPNKNIPVFNLLGYNIQEIKFKRIGNEDLKEIRILAPKSEYNKETRIYSLILRIELDFEQSKGSMFQILGGFEINDETILEDETTIIPILSASLYPYIRTLVYNTTLDDRNPIKLPAIDLRVINLETGLVLTRK